MVTPGSSRRRRQVLSGEWLPFKRRWIHESDAGRQADEGICETDWTRFRKSMKENDMRLAAAIHFMGTT